ncbi:MAG: HEPN domain-containing protein [Candidatus Aminicenantes bacterium]|nr:HEPN domain-containing protein [Candidatus Aminicenantes bacterium]
MSKEEYKKFLKKADEFFEIMQQSLKNEKWNAAGLNAIHTGISANDALLTFHFGLRSISPKHDDAVKLLISMMKRDDTEIKAKHLRRLISVKNLVEYDGTLLSRREAESVAKHAERFLVWVRSLLP